MTDAQWAFEIAALRLATEDRDTYAKQMFDAMKELLGLTVFEHPGMDFVPLSLICGNHHLIQRLVENDPRLATEDGGQRVANTVDDFDTWSKAIAEGNTDLLDDLLPSEDEVIQPREGQSMKVDFDDG